MKEQLTRYDPARDPKPEDRTDWEAVRALSDAEIERRAAADPDAMPLPLDAMRGGFRPNEIAAIRKQQGLSQAEFASKFGINLRTLQDWEHGRRQPEQTARSYLRVIARDPQAVLAALKAG